MLEERKQTNNYLVSNVDTEGLNASLTHPFRVVIEAAIRGEYHTWPELQQNICGLFATKMRVLAQKNTRYKKFVLSLNELGLLAYEGKNVYTTTSTTNFDFKQVFKALEILTRGKIVPADVKLGELTLYPVKNFPIDMKKDVIYKMLSEVHPYLLEGIKKHKLPLYLTEDFHLAVGCDFWDHEDLCDCIGKHRQFDFYQFSPTFKLYVLHKPLAC